MSSNQPSAIPAGTTISMSSHPSNFQNILAKILSLIDPAAKIAGTFTTSPIVGEVDALTTLTIEVLQAETATT